MAPRWTLQDYLSDSCEIECYHGNNIGGSVDRIIRKLGGFDRNVLSLEDRERERQAWEAAELTRDYLNKQPVYAATLTTTEDPSVGVFAFVDYHMGGRPWVNIPLHNDTPDEVLVTDYYNNATFFGEIDQERFTVRATMPFEINRLMAFLNRQTAGMGVSEASEWFHKNFDINYNSRYGSVFASSLGGSNDYGEDHTVTFETDFNGWNEPESPEDFARRLGECLPYLNLTPLPKQGYLQAVQSALPFLPRDWNRLN